MKILVINGGSSSIKYQLIDMVTNVVMAKGNCSRIGIDGNLSHKTHDGYAIEEDIPMPDHAAAIKIIINLLAAGEHPVIADMNEITAVGHRIVHGGERFKTAALVTNDVLIGLEEVVPLAPLHNPGHIVCIKACLKVLNDVPNVVVFDTAFHQTMPRKAYMYALPYEYYTKYHIRRYGFHGTSHRYLSLRVAELLGKDVKDLKIISCHIGNGSSITAISQGKSVDTSMGFTPLAGVCMGTRCGTVDPSAVTFIMDKENISPNQMDDIMNKKSGFLGISGISSDSRELSEAVEEGNDRARLTQEMLRYQIKKHIGSYAAAMGGVDVVIFSAGIGENNAGLRFESCEGLEFMGISIDKEKNEIAIRGKEMEISGENATVKTFVIPTNEEYMIAHDTKEIIEKLK
jgi:acetate kinase